MWIFITPHEHVMCIKNDVSRTSSRASSVNKITLKIILVVLYIFTKLYSLHVISWLHGFVLFVRGKDQHLVLLKYARPQGVKLLPGVLVFAYLFQFLFRLLLESVVIQYPLGYAGGLPPSSVLEWNFPVSLNRGNVEDNVFDRYNPVWKLFPVQYLHLDRIVTRSTVRDHHIPLTPRL
jgi:hypothetical protein